MGQHLRPGRRAYRRLRPSPSAVEPFTPLVGAASSDSWLQLSRSLPKPVLDCNTWYQQCVLASGFRDLLGTPLFTAPAHDAVLLLQEESEQAVAAPVLARRLDRLLPALRTAARLHHAMRELGWRSALALQALDRVAAGVIGVDVTDGC